MTKFIEVYVDTIINDTDRIDSVEAFLDKDGDLECSNDRALINVNKIVTIKEITGEYRKCEITYTSVYVNRPTHYRALSVKSYHELASLLK